MCYAARRVGEQVVLSPVTQIDSRIERVFVSIPWGKRRYLVPPTRMHAFCDEVIARTEPRTRYQGHFYTTDPEGRVAGLPQLPSPWTAYLFCQITQW